MDQLKRQKWILVSYCHMCKNVEESVNHLLIHCGKAESATTLLVFLIWHLVGSSFFSERIVNGLS